MNIFIDIDDTILAQCLGKTYDLRPGVMTQILTLTKLPNITCYWATHWDYSDVKELLYGVNANTELHNVEYLHWRKINKQSKAPAIVGLGGNFYWLEDKHSTGSLELLEKNGLMDRYIPVEPTGMWGFTRALRVLFGKAGITEKAINDAGGHPEWFNEPLGLHFDWHYSE